MRRVRIRRQEPAVSLFPFLAVLICTMGVLIVLLVLVVKHADLQASQVESEDLARIQQESQQLQQEKEKQDLRSELLNEMRPDVKQRLEDARLKRSHLEDHIRQLQDEAKQLASQWQQLQQTQQNPGPSDQVARRLQQIQKQIQEATRQLERAKQTAANHPVSYAIVPHQGSSTTFRRPIYIECTGRGLILQPYGIVLTPDDFTSPLVAGNPLDAALLAVREYWQRIGQGNSQGEPYPLLIVRPDGAQAYAIARQAMKSWDDEFGYELVDQEINLEFPGDDPLLAEQLRRVIQQAKQRQQRLMAAAELAGGGSHGAGGGQDPRLTLRASSRHGGFVVDGSSPSSSSGGRRFSDSARSSAQASRTNRGQQENQRAPRQANAAGGAQGQASQPGGQNRTAHGSAMSSISRTRGQDWALPTKTTGATAFRRPIRVSCGNDFLVVQPEAHSRARRQVIQLTHDTSASIDEFVDAVWKRIESWGPAGVNVYWKPEIKVDVQSGGEARFRELQILMDGSGITVERKQP